MHRTMTSATWPGFDFSPSPFLSKTSNTFQYQWHQQYRFGGQAVIWPPSELENGVMSKTWQKQVDLQANAARGWSPPDFEPEKQVKNKQEKTWNSTPHSQRSEFENTNYHAGPGIAVLGWRLWYPKRDKCNVFLLRLVAVGARYYQWQSYRKRQGTMDKREPIATRI